MRLIKPIVMKGNVCTLFKEEARAQLSLLKGGPYATKPDKPQQLLYQLSTFNSAADYATARQSKGQNLHHLPGQILSGVVQRFNSPFGQPSPVTSGGFVMASGVEATEWQAEEASTSGRSTSTRNNGTRDKPDHLVLLVNGIFASANDWSYVAGELTKRLGPSVLVHASTANSYFQTFQGIDVSGRRLAEEVREVSRRRPSLRRITVVGHSLGGLIARYAIGMLYVPGKDSSGDSQGQAEGRGSLPQQPVRGSLAGLEPVSFITLATPHLGVRGNKQLPFLLGLDVLESLAPPLAPLLVGRTGRQLFLSDEIPAKGKRPLLLRMSADGPNGSFISALGAFQLRVLYANVGYDHMVGWRTSSVRRESELPQLPRKALSPRYKHVVLVEEAPACHHPSVSSAELADSMRNATRTGSANEKAAKYHDVLEEEMIGGLQQVSWRRVDVNFREAVWPFFAHNNIHVKSEWLHYEGAGVIAHLADTVLEMEPDARPYAHL